MSIPLRSQPQWHRTPPTARASEEPCQCPLTASEGPSHWQCPSRLGSRLADDSETLEDRGELTRRIRVHSLSPHLPLPARDLPSHWQRSERGRARATHRKILRGAYLPVVGITHRATAVADEPTYPIAPSRRRADASTVAFGSCRPAQRAPTQIGSGSSILVSKVRIATPQLRANCRGPERFEAGERAEHSQLPHR